MKSNYANFERPENLVLSDILYEQQEEQEIRLDLKQQFHLDSPSLRLLPTLRHLAESQDNVGYVDEV